MQLVRVTMMGAALAAWLGACGITLDVAPDDGADAEATSSSSSTSGGSTSSSSGGIKDSGPTSSSGNSGPDAAPDGCTPRSKAEACTNVACGDVSDGCAGTIPCDDTCVSPQTCGGATPTDPHQCGCTPTATACATGQNCGSIPDGCGGTVSCGAACVGQDTCVNHVCTCQPNPNACNGKECGDAPNGCGGNTAHCGDCAGFETCGGGSEGPFKCGCTKKTAMEAGCTSGNQNPCERKADGCGAFLDCGDCNGGNHCQFNGAGNANTCVAN